MPCLRVYEDGGELSSGSIPLSSSLCHFPPLSLDSLPNLTDLTFFHQVAVRMSYTFSIYYLVLHIIYSDTFALRHRTFLSALCLLESRATLVLPLCYSVLLPPWYVIQCYLLCLHSSLHFRKVKLYLTAITDSITSSLCIQYMFIG